MLKYRGQLEVSICVSPPLLVMSCHKMPSPPPCRLQRAWPDLSYTAGNWDQYLPWKPHLYPDNGLWNLKLQIGLISLAFERKLFSQKPDCFYEGLRVSLDGIFRTYLFTSFVRQIQFPIVPCLRSLQTLYKHQGSSLPNLSSGIKGISGRMDALGITAKLVKITKYLKGVLCCRKLTWNNNTTLPTTLTDIKHPL